MTKRWLGLLLLGAWLGGSRVAHAAFNEMPNPLDFGNVTVGQSLTLTETLTATGATDETVTIVLHGGADCNQFQIVSPTMPIRVRAGMDGVVQVKFAPTTPGDKTCQVDENRGGAAFRNFMVQGHAAAPQIGVTPAGLALSFGSVEVGATSTAQSVTATNNGDATLTISSATISAGSADYTLSGVASGTLPPTQSTTWMIACRPSAQDSRPGIFHIVSDSVTNSTIDVALSCTGQQGVLTTIPTSHDFGGVIIGSSVPFNFQLKNTGNVTVANITGALADTTKGYVFDPATVPGSLTAGTSANLTVTFAPTSGTSGGAVNLNFQGRWGTSNTLTSAALQLNGDGQTASFTATPSPLAFGNFRFDLPQTLPFHIKNTGEATISIDSVTFAPDPGTAAGEVTFPAVAMGTMLTPNQQIDVMVTVMPNNRTGAIGGKFTVHSNTMSTSDQLVTVTGNATAATFTATAMTDFGAVDVSATPPTRTVTITNTGNATLDINSIVLSTDPNPPSPAFTFMTLPTMKTTVAPGGHFDIVVTYHPTTVRPPGDFDTAVLVATFGGVLNEPQMAMMLVQGRGIDSMLMLQAAPVFPATFRNPGDKAPIRAITVHNNGEVVLHITQVTLTGNPVWQLLDASPVDIGGGSSHDFMVKFAPTAVGTAPTGMLTLTQGGTRPPATVTLSGVCMDRNISFGGHSLDPPAPTTIMLPFTRSGQAIAVDDALAVSNLDSSVTFKIQKITIEANPAFTLVEPPVDAPLPPNSGQNIAIVFQPPSLDHFETQVHLFIDQDPEVQASVKLVGDAVFPDAHGSGGC
ncbi:MAG TPA: choice-of-anchor D domain-containing protein, partial [Kofleriaceae bacterium]